MIIRNKYLNITNEDVQKQTDLNTLNQWLLDIDENIVTMDITINRAKSKAFQQQIFSDPKWFERITTARRLQGLLKNQILNRIREIKLNDKDLNQYIIQVVSKFFVEEEWSEIIKLAKQLNDKKNEL